QFADHEQRDGRHRADVEEVGDDAHDTREKLAEVAVQGAAHTAGDTVEALAVGAVGEDAERDDAPRAVDAVNGDRTDRVVYFERAFDEQCRADDEYAGDHAD